MQSSAQSPSFGSFLQYAFLAGVAYFLAGAPFLSMITSYTSTSPRDTSTASALSLDKLDSLAIPEANLVCQEHNHKGVYVLSREPLVVYIEGFLDQGEAEEIVNLRSVHGLQVRMDWHRCLSLHACHLSSDVPPRCHG